MMVDGIVGTVGCDPIPRTHAASPGTLTRLAGSEFSVLLTPHIFVSSLPPFLISSSQASQQDTYSQRHATRG